MSAQDLEQPAPVDLEQFREAVDFMLMRGTREQCIRAGNMLQAIIDNAGKVECAEVSDYIASVPDKCDRIIWRGQYHHLPPHQPAPVVDDARMARALEWVRTAARGKVGEGDALRVALIESAREHLPGIEEAIAAYNPNCGARTVRVDDAAERLDDYLEKEHGVRIGRQAAIAALARAQGVQS